MIERFKKQFLGENKHRIILILVIVFFALLMFFYNSYGRIDYVNNVKLCNQNSVCELLWTGGFAQPLNTALPYLLISSFILIFVSAAGYKLWAKIMAPAFIIFLILVAISPMSCSSKICFDRSTMSLGFSIIYLIATALIILESGPYSGKEKEKPEVFVESEDEEDEEEIKNFKEYDETDDRD